jgi:hypothetical protein
MKQRSPLCRFAAPLALLASACFDGGDYLGGGRRIEAPAMADVRADTPGDTTTTEDALPEGGGSPGRQDGDVAETSSDAPRSEPAPDVEDGDRVEPEAAPTDVTMSDVAPADARVDGPPPSSPDATDPRDAALDVPVRDAAADARRD